MTSDPISAGIRETALKAMLRGSEDLAYPLVTVLEERPLTLEIISPHPLGRAQKIAIGILLAFAGLFVVLGLFDTNLTMVLIALFFVLLVGFAYWIAVARTQMAWRVTWRDDHVEVDDRRWGRNAHWSLPYSRFNGIAVRNDRIQAHGVNSHRMGRRIQIVELVHEDPGRTVLLETRDPSPDVEDRARANAQHIGVPYLGLSE